MSARMYWWYHDEAGRRVFQHYRYSRTPTPDNPREKGYFYRYPKLVQGGVVVEWCYEKHPQADRLLYRLPWVLANADENLALTEGERCADAAWRLGVLASSHHGGAGKFTEPQAQSLAAHRGRIVLVADNDPAGARDVCRRFDLLRDVGIPAGRLRVREVVPRHRGADLRDHLEAGYSLKALRRADLGRLREVAATVTGDPSEGSWPDALTPEEAAQFRSEGWRPQIVPRVREPRRDRAGALRRSRDS